MDESRVSSYQPDGIPNRDAMPSTSTSDNTPPFRRNPVRMPRKRTEYFKIKPSEDSLGRLLALRVTSPTQERSHTHALDVVAGLEKQPIIQVLEVLQFAALLLPRGGSKCKSQQLERRCYDCSYNHPGSNAAALSQCPTPWSQPAHNTAPDAPTRPVAVGG